MAPVIVFDTSLFSLALHFGVGPFYVSTTDLFCGANAAIRWGLRLRLVTWGTAGYVGHGVDFQNACTI